MNTNNRYRCNACGNLTRFDVIKMQRTAEFHHFTTDGKLAIEDQKILEEHIESVNAGGVKAVLTLLKSRIHQVSSPLPNRLSYPQITVGT